MALDAPLPVLSHEDELLRALLRAAELEDPRRAFFIRDGERQSGLSVNFRMTLDECRRQDCFSVTYGVRSMIVSAVKGLNLDVIPDAPNHANITGIPHSDDDPDTAEFLAGRLLEISQLVSEGKLKNAKRM